MAPPARRAQPRDTDLPQGRKETQRARLLAGIVAVANDDGYTATNVSAVIAHARVSRPTFYEYFAGTEDCFLAALADANERLLARIANALAAAPGEPALRTVLAGLVDFARVEPELARFAMSEALGGGPEALAARDRAIAAIAELAEGASAKTAPQAATPDLPLWLAIGAVCRLLASLLRRGLPISGGLQDELLAWVDAYARPVDGHRWSDSPAGPAPGPSPYVPDSRIAPPPPLPRGRPRLSEEEVAENHRQRLLFAAARLASERGYTATTIAEIAKDANLDRRVFYAHFKDKQHIYAAVYEFGFQRLLAVTAGAFFAGESWPERVWEGARGLTQFIESNPAFAHVGFIEVYAIGPSAVQRIEDSVSAFTVFLQEGYQYRPRADPPSRVAIEAVATSFVELIYHQARASLRPQMRGLLALLAFLCLAPFLGQEQATEFIERQRAQERAGARAPMQRPDKRK